MPQIVVDMIILVMLRHEYFYKVWGTCLFSIQSGGVKRNEDYFKIIHSEVEMILHYMEFSIH